MAEKTPTEPKEPTKPPKDEGAFVEKKDFEKFQKSTEKTLDAILGLLEKQTAEPPKEETKATSPAAPEVANNMLPDQYVTIFEKYFDPKDGFTARLSFPSVDENGRESGGLTFTIVVPDKFSNITSAHRDFYKVDLRTKALLPHNLAKGIDDWCKLVANNLQYNKNIMRK